MRIKRLVVIATLIVTVGLFWSLQAGAYQLFTADDGNCSQCHTTWPGEGEHSLHTGFGCSICHFESDPVPSSSCSMCHGGAEVILQVHAGVQAPYGEYCGYCHDAVGVECRSWTELKNIFE